MSKSEWRADEPAEHSGRGIPNLKRYRDPLLLVTLLTASALPLYAQDPPTLDDELKRGALDWESAFEHDPAAAPPLENVGLGPLRLRSQSPIQALRLGILPNPPSTLQRGQWELRETMEWSRMWAQTNAYLLNFDGWSATHSVAYGFYDRMQLELGVTQSGWARAKTAGFVSGFHETLGIDQGGRNTRPSNDFAFQFRNPKTGELVQVEESEHDSAGEELFFTVHHGIFDGTEFLPTISGSWTVQTPLQDSEHLSGAGIDVAVSLSFAKKWGDVHAYVTMGLSWYGSERFHDLELKPYSFSMLMAAEWRAGDGVSFILQYQWAQGGVNNFGAFSQASHELTFGLKILVSMRSTIEVGFSENLVVFDNSPDFGMHAGLTLGF